MLASNELKIVIEKSDLSGIFVSKTSFEKYNTIILDVPILSLEDFFSPSFKPEGKLKTIETLQRDPSIAFLVYTSGTSGTQYGILLTHENVLINSQDVQNLIHVSCEERVLSPLPLNHMFAISSTVLSCILGGGCIILLERLMGDLIVHAFETRQITGMTAVPRLYEALYQGIWDKVEKNGNFIRIMFSFFSQPILFLSPKTQSESWSLSL